MDTSFATPDTKKTQPSLTSFSQLFERDIEGHIIREIEIPLIQRDYAQGRKTDNVNRIRENFINSLCTALLPNSTPIDLDFVFGDVEDQEGENKGKFYPLDGQQRLTTLFLLHCYLGWQTNVELKDQSWRKFSYATRPGARAFCNFLVGWSPIFSDTLSASIKDDADYLPTWQHDPSIQSMLVVLDALHTWFDSKKPDMQIAWSKLIDDNSPAIRFHVLPMKINGLTDELYIKMNSRGKPLTPFENFKAHFDDILRKVHPEKASNFGKKVDTIWSDILWPYRGDDHLIDDEFMRYFRFLTDICAWKDEIAFKDNLRTDDLAVRVYGADAVNGINSLDFHIKAWDIWKEKNIEVEFTSILTSQPCDSSTPLLMFNAFENEGVDLFHACCRHYGTRHWTLAHTLLFYGVILQFIHKDLDVDFSQRQRVLRNLVEASVDEIRSGERNNMPKLLIEVEQFIIHGELHHVKTFNQVQVRNEIAKAELLQADVTLTKSLHRLEDHELLCGGLTAFDLDPLKFVSRAQAFITLFDKSAHDNDISWKLITGALLAKGDYSRQENRFTGHRLAEFGCQKNKEPWKSLFRGKKNNITSNPLMDLLDVFATGTTLRQVITEYITSSKTQKDWRYYFVKYDSMREGASGRYTISLSGYQVCMLEKERMNSDYYDPYLLALVEHSQLSINLIANAKWPRCFVGYETYKRVLKLKNSGIQIECVDKGWAISEIPTDTARKEKFDRVCKTFEIGDDFVCVVPQNNGIDNIDRLELGRQLLVNLANV